LEVKHLKNSENDESGSKVIIRTIGDGGIILILFQKAIGTK
jgi:hypothetical protein